jgi:SAM-dependent methyltransferase
VEPEQDIREIPRDRLSFPRSKRRSVVRSLLFRSRPVLERVLGPEQTLRLFLHAERTAWRLAYEAAGRRYGEQFYNAVVALPGGTLQRWLGERRRVIDIGCGEGRVCRQVAKHAETVLGIDISPEYIQAARSKPHPENLSFRVGDARELPGGAYDVALLIHVLEHLDEPVEILTDVAGIADRLVVEVPRFDRDPLNLPRLELGLDFSSDDDHVREYTQAALGAELDAAGWTPTDWSQGPMSIAAHCKRGRD